MGKRILLVEDNEYTQNIYVKALTSAGFEVAVASNGQECLESVVLSLPDLILLDLMMPVKDGYDVLEKVKAATSTQQIPVLVVSARDDKADVQRALNLGAAGYLVKATTRPRDVVEKVTELLGRRSDEPPPRYYQVFLAKDALDAPRLAEDMKLSPSFTCPKCGVALVFRLTPKTMDRRRYFLGHFACPACEAKRSSATLKLSS